MFAEERQNMIVELVNQKGSIRVKDLSEKFHVTEDSIRKDLTLLEKKGLLKKIYGGAVKKRINVHDLSVSQRKEKNIEAKQQIAEKAIGLIKDGDMVFLDISTANLELARLIKASSLNITVVTNMIDIMLEFLGTAITKLVFIGGIFDRGHDGFVGSQTIEQIRNFRFDTAFMGVVGIDPFNNEVSTYMAEDGLTKKVIMENSRKSYMMLETRKFNTYGTFKYAKLDDFAGAVMEKKLSGDIKDKLKEYNMEWI